MTKIEPAAEVEEILQARTKQLHHHHIVVVLSTVVLHQRDTNPSLHHLNTQHSQEIFQSYNKTKNS